MNMCMYSDCSLNTRRAASDPKWRACAPFGCFGVACGSQQVREKKIVFHSQKSSAEHLWILCCCVCVLIFFS